MAWGLSIEKKAEKLLPPQDFKPDIFDSIIEAQKKEVERGWRILMVGVVVEVVAALGISIISGLEIADLSEKTAAAHLEAKQAETNSAASYERAANAEKEAGQANERAAKFDADRVVIEKEAEEIRETNFLLQTKLVTLETAIKWRTITPDQETNLVKELKPFTQANLMLRFPVNVSVVGDIAESRRYAERISDVLTKCGFDVKFDDGINFGMSKTNGLVFAVPPHMIKPIPIQATLILVAFRNEKIPVIDETDDQVDNGILQIWVLPKPEE